MKFFLNRVDVAGSMNSTSVELTDVPTVLGRGMVLLDIGDLNISRNHFELRVISGSIVLLKSTAK